MKKQDKKIASSYTYMNQLNVLCTLNEMQCSKLHKWFNFVVPPSIHGYCKMVIPYVSWKYIEYIANANVVLCLDNYMYMCTLQHVKLQGFRISKLCMMQVFKYSQLSYSSFTS
jgi:hypothetical protein